MSSTESQSNEAIENASVTPHAIRNHLLTMIALFEDSVKNCDVKKLDPDNFKLSEVEKVMAYAVHTLSGKTGEEISLLYRQYSAKLQLTDRMQEYGII